MQVKMFKTLLKKYIPFFIILHYNSNTIPTFDITLSNNITRRTRDDSYFRNDKSL